MASGARRSARPAGPAVALETAFLTSGLPDDARMVAVDRMDEAVRSEGSVPAFVGVLKGRPVVGLERDELLSLAGGRRKLSTRDLAVALARGESGGTTVAATLFLAHRAGLSVVATGGIGGVHIAGARAADVSADLHELARTPVIVVCSGPKAITDLPATLERLETLGVTIVGFGTDELPAFWSAHSGLKLDQVVESAGEAARIWQSAGGLGMPGALLVCVPPPPDAALSRDESESAVRRALDLLEDEDIRGPRVTPFLLERIAQLTGGRSLQANLRLLVQNAGVAGAIARAVSELTAVPAPHRSSGSHP